MTQRDGNWSTVGGDHSSPWWSSDAQIVGSEIESSYPGAGSTVIVRHDLTVDVDITIGLSLQAALWVPPDFTTTGGTTVTSLPTGTYTAAATVFSPMGETQLAGSTMTLSLTTGVSKPRVLFADFPPTGCTYRLYLDDPSRSGGDRMTLYCSDIGGTTVELVPDAWGNTWDNGVTTGGAVTNQNSTSPQTAGAANAITIKSAGSITIADGKRLAIRGDVVIESSASSKKPFILVGKGSTYRMDPSAATDPTRARYQMVFQGGGDVRFLG